MVITARKRSLGQGNIFRSVCQEFCPQVGGSTWAGIPPRPGTPPQDQLPTPPGTRYTPCQDQVTPQDQVHHPGPGTPPRTRYITPLGPGTPPRTRYTTPPLGPGTPLQDQASPWDQTPPPEAEHAGRYDQRAGGTHPTGMHSCCYF